MHLNLVVLAGRLAAPPESRPAADGAAHHRYLVTVVSERPRRRVDVLAVTQLVPQGEAAPPDALPGRRLFVAASVHRRFWDAEPGRRSRLELVAHHIEVLDDDDEDPV